MRCPKCASAPLQPTEVRPGLEVDSCPGCAGLWLDKAEVYHFVKRPEDLKAQFVEAYKVVEPTKFACPRCERPMMRAIFPAGSLEFEACAMCGGNWFDAGEVQKLGAALDSAVAAAGEKERKPGDTGAPVPAARVVSPRPEFGQQDFSTRPEGKQDFSTRPDEPAARVASEAWSPDPNMPRTSASKGLMAALVLICACAGLAVIAGVILRAMFPQLF